MPSYKFHLSAGLVLLLVFTQFFNKMPLVQFISYLSVTIVYSLLPDIDANNSKIGKITRIFLLLFAIILISFDRNLLSLIFVCITIILFVVKHRGFFHTIRCAIICSLPLLFVDIPLAILGFLVYFSHLALDRHIKF